MKKFKRKINLLEGDILKNLLLLSAPLMATSFINMAYNMTDMAWLGRLGNDAVAAIGTAHFFIWIASSLGLISKIGTSVYAAHEYGSGNTKRLNNTIKNGIVLAIITALVYTLFINIFANDLIGFYNLSEAVLEDGVSYLRIMSIGFIFSLNNFLISSIYNSLGNSFIPFIANVTGLLLNIFLDPILIFGFGPIPALEVKGAALASVISQLVVLLILVIDIIRSKNEIYISMKEGKTEISNIIEKFIKGAPAGAMSIFHALVSMVLARFISDYGTIPMAVYSVGAQIESVTWMTTEGFSGGIVAFVGQNYGAKKYDRLKLIIKKSIKSVSFIGVLGTLILAIFRYELFELFVPNEPVTNVVGARYLLILATCQLFMALEIGISAVFNGLGKTKVPATINTIFNIMRIPISLLLMPYYKFYGVYMAMTISTIFKGVVSSYFLYKEYKNIGGENY